MQLPACRRTLGAGTSACCLPSDCAALSNDAYGVLSNAVRMRFPIRAAAARARPAVLLRRAFDMQPSRQLRSIQWLQEARRTPGVPT